MNLHLSESQQKAATHFGSHLLVIAGPGSGKTFTIIQRIHYLIQEKNIPPSSILVITFTKDAAKSLEQRFLASSRFTLPVHFGTFHSVFYHIYSSYPLSGTPKLISTKQKIQILQEALKKYPPPNKMDSLNTLCISFLEAISYCKNTGSMAMPEHLLPQEYTSVFKAIYSYYETIRISQHLIDFDDMILDCYTKLTMSPSFLTKWRNRFSHILIDEFQDINPMQYKVIQLLTGPEMTVFAVGDDDQSIYGFRGASPSCMKNFEEDFHADILCLNENYRSGRAIVEVANRVISENTHRYPKSFRPILNNSGTVDVHSFVESVSQYKYIRDTVLYMKQDTSCILFRTNLSMQSFAAYLIKDNIPFQMKTKSPSPYMHTVCRDILAYLRIINQTGSTDDYVRVINKPSRYIHREALMVPIHARPIDRYSPDNILSNSSTNFSSDSPLAHAIQYYKEHKDLPYAEQKIEALQIFLSQLQFLQNKSPILCIRFILNKIGYCSLLHTQDEEEHIRFLLDEGKSFQNISDFLHAAAQYEDHYKNPPQTSSSNITLMTIHAAKGLEFDHVFIPNINEKEYPHGKMPDEASVEEERRIFYVGMTRAKKSLHLSYLTGTEQRPRLKSRFLNPLIGTIEVTDHPSQSSPQKR